MSFSCPLPASAACEAPSDRRPAGQYGGQYQSHATRRSEPVKTVKTMPRPVSVVGARDTGGSPPQQSRAPLLPSRPCANSIQVWSYTRTPMQTQYLDMMQDRTVDKSKRSKKHTTSTTVSQPATGKLYGTTYARRCNSIHVSPPSEKEVHVEDST